MAKRARGATRRPGQRRPTQRSGPRPSAAVPTGLEGAAASAVEPAAVPAEPTRTVSPAVRTRSRLPSSAFAAEAAQEYAYVVSDVRRIVIVAGGIIGIMLVLFVVIDVLRIVQI
ncbi:MAG: hypothetical protein ABI628_10185 [Chloroflexota bacterium]